MNACFFPLHQPTVQIFVGKKTILFIFQAIVSERRGASGRGEGGAAVNTAPLTAAVTITVMVTAHAIGVSSLFCFYQNKSAKKFLLKLMHYTLCTLMVIGDVTSCLAFK